MKKLEIILGIVAIAFMIIGLLMVFPFFSLTYTLTMLFLSLLYFWLSFALLNGVSFRKMFSKEAYKGISKWRMIGSIGTGFALSIVIISILFVYQQWPYGYLNLRTGLFMLGVIFIVIVIKKGLSFDNFYKFITLRLVIVGIVGLSLLYLPAETLLELRCHGCSEAYLEAEKALLNDPNNRELQEKAYQERIKMEREEEEKRNHSGD